MRVQPTPRGLCLNSGSYRSVGGVGVGGGLGGWGGGSAATLSLGLRFTPPGCEEIKVVHRLL